MSCRKVSSPIPEDNEASDIPRRRGDRDEDSAIILVRDVSNQVVGTFQLMDDES